MKLMFDCGNSRLKWMSVAHGGDIVARGVASGSLDVAIAELARSVTGVDAVHAAVVSGAHASAALAEAVSRAFGLQATFSASLPSFRGLRNGYDIPGSLGVDRWLAMIGARLLCGGPIIVVDAGTAMTIDVVTDSGEHLGGYVVPGLQAQCLSLSERSSAIGVVDAQKPDRAWGRRTSDGVANGVAGSLAALVDSSQRELHRLTGRYGNVVLSGGDARTLSRLLTASHFVDEDLVFRGLFATISPPEVNLAGTGSTFRRAT